MGNLVEFWIYIGGEHGGTMKVVGMDHLANFVNDGPDPSVCNKVLPKGTRAIEWVDPLDWEWLLDGVPVEHEQIFLYNSPEIIDWWKSKGGEPVEKYIYSGGLLAGPDDEDPNPCFETPLLGGAGGCMPPEGVVNTFVIRLMSTTGVHFLEEDRSIIRRRFETTDLFADPPPTLDPCKLTPLFCNLNPTRYDSICKQIKICPEGEEMEVGTLRGRDLIAAAGMHLAVAAGALQPSTATAGRDDALAAVREARSRVEKALAFAQAAQRAHATVLRVVREASGMPFTRRFANQASAALERGVVDLSACLSRLDGDLNVARGLADLAWLHLNEALDNALRMRAWAIPAEAQATAEPATSGAATTVTVPTDTLVATRAADAAASL